MQAILRKSFPFPCESISFGTSSPQSSMVMRISVVSAVVGTVVGAVVGVESALWGEGAVVGIPAAAAAAIASTSARPSTTRPKTTCLPLRCGSASSVMKNCEPLPSRPLLAIESSPLRSCGIANDSSSNVLP